MGVAGEGSFSLVNSCRMGEKLCQLTLYRVNSAGQLLSSSVCQGAPVGFGFSWTPAHGRLYLFSGQATDGGWLEDLYELRLGEDCAVRRIRTKGPRPVARAYASLTAVSDFLVLFGGQNDVLTLNDLWVLDLRSEQWQQQTQAGRPASARKGHSATFVEAGSLGFLVLIGGRGEEEYYSDVNVLKTQLRDGALVLTWVAVAVQGSVPESREGHSTVLLQNRLLLLGGCNYQQRMCFRDVWELALTEDSFFRWSALTPLNSGLSARERALALPISAVELVVISGSGLNSEPIESSYGLVVHTSCQQGCASLHARFESGRCICADGRVGSDCHAADCPQDCLEHGACLRGVCVCEPGFTGQACERAACSKGCSGRGTCDVLSGVCTCYPNFTGKDCSDEVAALPAEDFPCECGPNGHCEKGSCICTSPYHGLKCELTGCSSLCGESQGRGHCNSLTGKCSCKHDYGGEMCQFHCPDCEANYCVRDGLCMDSVAATPSSANCYLHGNRKDGSCRCEEGFCGEFCERQDCVYCSGNGHYTESGCVCIKGFSGLSCEIECPNQCSGQGECRAGICQCEDNFAGPDCASEACIHGSIQGTKCICSPGYYGLACAVSQSCPQACLSRGICHLGRCFCEAGFEGEDCALELPCPAQCNGQGECVQGRCLCRPGYTGESCAKSECECGLHGMCVNSRCLCAPRWTGPGCAARLDPCADCIHGLCRAGICECEFGYTGPNCEKTDCQPSCVSPLVCKSGLCQPACPNNCSSAGECILGECRCHPGFSGKDCGLSVNCTCSGHGECKEGTCACEQHYSGRDCSVFTPPACPRNCSGRGRCHLGKCFCDLGMLGTDCSLESVCPPTCGSGSVCVFGSCRCVEPLCSLGCPDMCSGHGNCAEAGTCLCEAGYYGENCSLLQESGCGVNGRLNELGGCTCLPGWKGSHCEERVRSLCPGAGVCSGHGTCVDGTCHCEPGYLGLACSLAQPCPADCNLHGVCSRGLCFCIPGWTGDDCSRRECSHTCSSRGSCLEGTCVCRTGGGLDCSLRLQEERVSVAGCTAGCNGHGECLLGECHCEAGWTGFACKAELSLSLLPACMKEGSECSGRGVCINGSCRCSQGYLGAFCELSLRCTDCSSLTSHCVEGVCLCVAGWTNPPICDVPEEAACAEVKCGSNGVCRGGLCYCLEGHSANGPGEACTTAGFVGIPLVVGVGVVYGLVMWTCSRNQRWKSKDC